jgi:Uma2 family endonuclease
MLNDVDRLYSPGDPVPILESGDRMTQAEFHRLYEQMPEDFRAELIGGVVYVSSPMKRRHGKFHLPAATLVTMYESATPGVEACDNATVILDEGDEPQPDLLLRVLPEYGGQSRTTSDDYVDGAPELHWEIAASSKSLDLHGKRERYAAAGVKEYLVLNLQDKCLHWFDLTTNTELKPDADGIYRIRTFSGLWIDGPALITRDLPKLLAVLEQGLASPEHTVFVAKLAAAHAEHEAAGDKS